MGDIETDLARATEAAWQGFQQELAQRISELDDGASFLVLADDDHVDDDDGCGPYLQVGWLDEDLGLAEVSSNRYLHPRHRLDKAARRRLREMGWVRPGDRPASLNYTEQFELFRSEEMADKLVVVLREVFGVIHPAFLGGDIETRVESGPPAAHVVPAGEPSEPLAVEPEDHEHLDRLVEQALVPVFGHTPKRDCDGDIGVRAGTAAVFVRVVPDHFLIRLFAELAVEVTDHQAAKFEVEVLNRDKPFAKFELVNDHVLAMIHLPASPFVPEHLRQTLAMMCALADEVDDDLAVRVKGRRFHEPTDPSIEELLTDED